MAETLNIRFYQDKFLMGFASEQAGHPVFEDRDFIEINIPGDMNNVIQRPVTDNDKKQWAAMYARYKEGLEPSVDGVPLEAWARLTPASVANYKAAGVKTVEHIAGMSDQVCNKVSMGAMADRTAAKAYLAGAKDSALAQKQALVIERQDQQIADLQRQINELAAYAEKPKRGRPVKETEEA
jgi:hypothetical protein